MKYNLTSFRRFLPPKRGTVNSKVIEKRERANRVENKKRELNRSEKFENSYKVYRRIKIKFTVKEIFKASANI